MCGMLKYSGQICVYASQQARESGVIIPDFFFAWPATVATTYSISMEGLVKLLKATYVPL